MPLRTNPRPERRLRGWNVLYEKVSDLTVEIAGYRLEPRLLGGTMFTRHTTTVVLEGGGRVGRGEDVDYDANDQLAFQNEGLSLPLAGTWTIDSFSRHLDGLDLFPIGPARPDYALYRRWAFESAALELALEQAGRTLGEALKIDPRPVRFVVSMGLGSPASTEGVERCLEKYPATRFKVDVSSSWDQPLVRRLADLGVIDTVDLKGHYHGDFEGPPPDLDQYRLVCEGLPDAVVEDPASTPETAHLIEAHQHRLAWDAPIHSVSDIVQLPWKPPWMNIKPSRFGFVSELLRAYEYCQGAGIRMYGGGQFELGHGRLQNQALASLFHPDGPNDVAPTGYNEAEMAIGLECSPLPVEVFASAFGSRGADD